MIFFAGRFAFAEAPPAIPPIEDQPPILKGRVFRAGGSSLNSDREFPLFIEAKDLRPVPQFATSGNILAPCEYFFSPLRCRFEYRLEAACRAH